jgi:hypothetical protein
VGSEEKDVGLNEIREVKLALPRQVSEVVEALKADRCLFAANPEKVQMGAELRDFGEELWVFPRAGGSAHANEKPMRVSGP